MNSLQQQYLDAMGITVWVRRSLIAPAESNAHRDTAPETRHNEVPAAETGVAKAPPPVATSVPVTSPLDAFRNSLQPKSDSPVTRQAAEPDIDRMASPLAREASAEGEMAANSGAEQDRPSFLLLFLSYPVLEFVLSFSYDTASLPKTHQQFLDDVYFSLTGERAASARRELRWPMVKSTQIPQTAADASQVVREMLQTVRTPLVLFGPDAGRFCTTEELALYQAGSSEDRRVLLVHETERYFSQPLLRRELWQAVRHMKPGEQGSDT